MLLLFVKTKTQAEVHTGVPLQSPTQFVAVRLFCSLRFLKELVSLGRPGRVLEIGMFVGYGAVAMLEGCSSTRVVSLEIDPFLKDWLSHIDHY